MTNRLKVTFLSNWYNMCNKYTLNSFNDQDVYHLNNLLKNPAITLPVIKKIKL